MFTFQIRTKHVPSGKLNTVLTIASTAWSGLKLDDERAEFRQFAVA